MSGILMLKQRLIELLAQAAGEAQQLGKLPSLTLPDITIEHPQNPEHGDYASSLPLKLARATGVNPMTIADEIVGLMIPTPEIDSIAVAPPGFINFTLKSDWLTSQVELILKTGDSYGNNIDASLMLGSSIDLTSADSPNLKFWHKYERSINKSLLL